jgi:antitoxin VapB
MIDIFTLALSIYIGIYLWVEVSEMRNTKVFTCGNSLAIRLPKEYHIDATELTVQKIGNTLVFYPKENPWAAFEHSLDEFSADFLEQGRMQPGTQDRDEL